MRRRGRIRAEACSSYRPLRERLLVRAVLRGDVVCERRFVVLAFDFSFPVACFFTDSDSFAFESGTFFPCVVLGAEGGFVEGAGAAEALLVEAGADFSVCLGASGRLGRRPPAPSRYGDTSVGTEADDTLAAGSFSSIGGKSLMDGSILR